MKNHRKKRPTRAEDYRSPTTEAKKQVGSEKYDLKKLGLLPSELKAVQPSDDLPMRILELIMKELVDETSDQPVLVDVKDLTQGLLMALGGLMMIFRKSTIKMTGQDIPIEQRIRVAANLQDLVHEAIARGLGDPLP